MTLAVAARDFFGLRAGTTLREFTEEWRALSQAGKDEIRIGLIANGHNIKTMAG